MPWRPAPWALACVLAVLALPAGAAAQGDAASLARTVAQAWARRDVGTIGSLMQPSGLRVQLDGEGHTGVSPRQARASLASFLDRHEVGEVRVRRTEVLGGVPAKGFAELDWVVQPRGARESVAYVIFLGLERSDDQWRIDEIRIVR